MFLHVLVCDHHQGVHTWTWLKLQSLKMFNKNKSLWTCSGVAAYCIKCRVMYMLCEVQDKTELCSGVAAYCVKCIVMYVGHLESKERLHIQPAQLLHCS
jgi:hypothetical protein